MSAIGGATFCAAALWFLLKTWLSRHIEAAVTHEYDRRIETLKFELQKDLEREKLEQKRSYERNAASDLADAKLFQSFLESLPPDSPGVMFPREHDLQGTFPAHVLASLDRFNEVWRLPDHEFHNPELEVSKKEFWSCLNEFLSELNVAVAPIGRGVEFFSAFSDRDVSDDVFEMQSCRAQELNKLSSVAIDKYDRLVRLGRRVTSC